MKQWILTGLGQETDFSKDGVVTFHLVFNKGELRVPITEEAARSVIQTAFGGATEQNDPPSVYSREPEDAPDDNDIYNEDGVGQV
jgi:hypothetical protein